MGKLEELIQGKVPVLVDYFATWCGPCKMMHPVLEELKKQLGDRLIILKVDIDNPVNRQHVAAHGVQAVPTFILFKEGEKLWRQSGAMQIGPLRQTIEQYL